MITLYDPNDWALFSVSAPIPPRAVVDGAELVLYLPDEKACRPDVEIFVDLSGPNPTKPIAERPRTKSSTRWEAVESTTGWRPSPDLTSLVQELVDSPVWRGGDKVTFLVHQVGSQPLTIMDYDTDSSRAAKVNIDLRD